MRIAKEDVSDMEKLIAEITDTFDFATRKIFKRKGDEIVGASKFKRLNKKVIAARKMEGIISLFVYIVIIVTLLYCTFIFHWPEWIVIITTCLAIISLPFELYWAPMWRYRIWRYKINETSIQIQKVFCLKEKY